jgi:hypothetical protein
MKTSRALLSAVLLLSSCHRLHDGHAATKHLVYLVDASASIVPASFDQAMNAVDRIAEQLQRGDCITVLPILSDSDAIPSDQIVRMCVPTERQPYDQDLQEFREGIHDKLAAQGHQLTLHRATKTDIIGTLALANQEFSLSRSNVQGTLIIFSDFIEEDTATNFSNAPELATPKSAERLATRLSSTTSTLKDAQASTGLRVFLGNLRSNEIETLPKQRREAIRRFWLAYFNAQHAHPFFATDGPGMNSEFLTQSE